MDLINALKMFTYGPGYFKTALKEKRDIPRLVINIKSRAQIDNRAVFLKIVDISLGGVKVECGTKLMKDQSFPITVEPYTKFLASGDYSVKTLMVKVAWCRKAADEKSFTAGLLFIDSVKNMEDSWVYYIFHKFGEKRVLSLQKRDYIRVPTKIYIVCTDTHERVKQGIIKNISIGGVMVECGKEIPVAETLQLIIGPYKQFKPFLLKGRVLRNSYFESTENWLVALEFADMTSKDYKNIGKLILDILKDCEKKK
jgi:hypothetical protein